MTISKRAKIQNFSFSKTKTRFGIHQTLFSLARASCNLNLLALDLRMNWRQPFSQLMEQEGSRACFKLGINLVMLKDKLKKIHCRMRSWSTMQLSSSDTKIFISNLMSKALKTCQLSSIAIRL